METGKRIGWWVGALIVLFVAFYYVAGPSTTTTVPTVDSTEVAVDTIVTDTAVIDSID